MRAGKQPQSTYAVIIARTAGKDKANIMTVMVYAPGSPGELREIDNTLAACQEVVDGYIETMHLTDELLIVCNEEGRLRGQPENRLGIVGTFFVCGVNGEEFASLDAGQVFTLERLLP